jgi:hypothetical protein
MSQLVGDSAERTILLCDLRHALNNPNLVERAMEKGEAEDLQGFMRWLRSKRVCKFCKRRRLSIFQEKFCGCRCRQRLYKAKRELRWRREGRKFWVDFENSVQTPIRVAELANQRGLDLADARANAEKLVEAGRLLAWRGPVGGPIREVGVPKAMAR